MVIVKVGKHGAYIKHRGKVEHVGDRRLCPSRRYDRSRRLLRCRISGRFVPRTLHGAVRHRSERSYPGHVIEVVGPTIDEHRWEDIRKKIEEVAAGTFLL